MFGEKIAKKKIDFIQKYDIIKLIKIFYHIVGGTTYNESYKV